jgi:hypothetical protein
MNRLPPLVRWDRGFESHSRHGYLRLFWVCIGSSLARGWCPFQGILSTVLELRNWSETKRFTDALCSKVRVQSEGNRKEKERERKRIYLATLSQLNFWDRYIRRINKERTLYFDISTQILSSLWKELGKILLRVISLPPDQKLNPPECEEMINKIIWIP